MKKILSKIFDYKQVASAFKDRIIFSALGARTCYNHDYDVNCLLEDERVVGSKIRDFLSKLNKVRHFSVFAHTFSWFEVEPDLAKEIAAYKFKSIYADRFELIKLPNSKSLIGLSLRHFLEDDEIFESLILDIEQNQTIQPVTLPQIDDNDNTQVSVLFDQDYWMVIYITNISRACSHQLVRHTILNFSQKSDRYTKIDPERFIIPPSIKEDMSAWKTLSSTYNTCYYAYNYLLENGLKKEDSRFVLPDGRTTSIMISGTLEDLYNFSVLRSHPHAQWEIRYIANKIKTYIKRSYPNIFKQDLGNIS